MSRMTDPTGLRDLDRAVAEAKGLRVEAFCCDNCGPIITDNGGLLAGHPLPRYSTDWAAAGPLLEEMRDSTPTLTIGDYSCNVGFSENAEGVFVNGEAGGATGPEAIARAYVAWKAATVSPTTEPSQAAR